MSNTALGRTNIALLTNKSGGDLTQGAVVVISGGTAAAFTTTTTVGFTDGAVGVILEPNGIANNATGLVAFAGWIPKINLSGSASLGDLFKTHSVAGQAVRHAAPAVQGDFGMVLATGTAGPALLFGQPVPPAAAGNVATDAIWDAAGDMVQATGNNAAAKLSIGTANQLLRVNSGATAVEWADLNRVLISEQTPTGTGTVTWSSIPATPYKHLLIEFVGRTDKGAQNTTSANLRFNNDTTDGNYQRQSNTFNNTTYSGGTAANPDAVTFVAAGATANYTSYGVIRIPFYALTVFNKTADILNLASYAAASPNTNWQQVHWHNNAAINRIDIIVDDSSNYIAGTTFRLYGVM